MSCMTNWLWRYLSAYIFQLFNFPLVLRSKTYMSVLNFAATGTLEWNDSASNISDEGFKGRLSLTAVLCEWICTFLIVLFSVSLVPEFRVIEIYRPVVVTKAYQKSLKAATPSTGAEVPDELEDVSDSNRNNAHHQPNDTSSEPLMQLPWLK